MHVANIEALRRAVALLDVSPAYVLTDGFPVDGLGVPGLAVWKGDRVAACISAASVLAKVTRDRIMTELDREWPAYDFKTHKGYITEVHAAALTEHGPCPVHRMRFVNVRRAAGLEPPAGQSRWGSPKTVRTPLEKRRSPALSPRHAPVARPPRPGRRPARAAGGRAAATGHACSAPTGCDPAPGVQAEAGGQEDLERRSARTGAPTSTRRSVEPAGPRGAGRRLP